MNPPKISNDFTIDDIHKIREYNHEITKSMNFEDRKSYYQQGANIMLELIEKRRKEM